MTHRVMYLRSSGRARAAVERLAQERDITMSRAASDLIELGGDLLDILSGHATIEDIRRTHRGAIGWLPDSTPR